MAPDSFRAVEPNLEYLHRRLIDLWEQYDQCILLGMEIKFCREIGREIEAVVEAISTTGSAL